MKIICCYLLGPIACVLLTAIAGCQSELANGDCCQELQGMKRLTGEGRLAAEDEGHVHGESESGHNHEHKHSHVPTDKPNSFAAGVQRIDNWLQNETLVSHNHQRALRVIGWLPELAIESDLPKEDWLVIYHHCIKLQESETKNLQQWRMFVDAMFDYRLEPTLCRPIVDGRDWH